MTVYRVHYIDEHGRERVELVTSRSHASWGASALRRLGFQAWVSETVAQ
jgi:hypothetical protein